jgi:hypothetical protein
MHRKRARCTCFICANKRQPLPGLNRLVVIVTKAQGTINQTIPTGVAPARIIRLPEARATGPWTIPETGSLEPDQQSLHRWLGQTGSLSPKMWIVRKLPHCCLARHMQT